MKAVRERTAAQQTAYKKAFRIGRTFKTKLDALVTLENKRVEEQKKAKVNEELSSFTSGYYTRMWATGAVTVSCCSGVIHDLDARPDFRPQQTGRGEEPTGRLHIPCMSG